ncbi:MAG TPA: hypothetical protein VNP04_31565 [Alphaproteobacteria bacterium]|nr:hypothetical protein [Alphaproteobacteria bacterium]
MSVSNIKDSRAAVERLDVTAYRIPADAPESDGTLAWDHTTIVLVEAAANGVSGLGYTYADAATARLIEAQLADIVQGCDAMAVPGTWGAMVQAIRNLGRPGIASMAIAAVDTALWDLKARLLGLPLVTLLGSVREGVPIYGSGSFTSYSIAELQQQLGGWVASDISRVKMKIGRHPADDLDRVLGVTGFLRVATLCQAHGIPLSAHTAPALHVHPCCSLVPVCRKRPQRWPGAAYRVGAVDHGDAVRGGDGNWLIHVSTTHPFCRGRNGVRNYLIGIRQRIPGGFRGRRNGSDDQPTAA